MLRIVDNATAELEVAQIFERLGAESESALRMARQLIRRASQQAREKSVPLEQALGGLLEKAIAGRLGTYENPPED
jgi:hypothetical protein